jgi:hypothetical protein
MNSLKISKQQLSALGANSLLGLVTKNGFFQPTDLEILFEETTEEWRREHKGADEIIVPEYVPACLCQDILTLIQMGFNLRVGTYN